MPDRDQDVHAVRNVRAVMEGGGADIAAFVRRRRKARRMSQASLAARAGVGTRFVSELERGKPTLRLDAVNRVLAVFGKRVGLADLERDGVIGLGPPRSK